MEFFIREARAEEASLLAEIEALCFPPAEAASKEEIQKRMCAFLENFFVAESSVSDAVYCLWLFLCDTCRSSLADAAFCQPGRTEHRLFECFVYGY